MTMPERIGKYRIERQIGVGAFAQVWLGHDDALDIPVAIKVLADNLATDADVRRRFTDEARLLAQLASDHFVRVLTVDELEGGRPYFVMEYASGGSLADRMRARLSAGQPWSVAEALDVSIEIAEALTVAHRMGVVHRDIKPSNILACPLPAHLRQEGRTERLVLADLGVARVGTGMSMTITAGTPHYMAPEQADGHADARSDVYGAAVVLYEMLAGTVPHPFDSIGMLLRAKAQPVAPLRTVRPDVPPALEAAVTSALSPDPAARPADGAAWAALLRAARQGLPPGGEETVMGPLALDPNLTMTAPAGATGPAPGTGGAVPVGAVVPPSSLAALAPPFGPPGALPPLPIPAGGPPSPPSGPIGIPPAGFGAGEPPRRPQRKREQRRRAVAMLAATGLIGVTVAFALLTSGTSDTASAGEIFLEQVGAVGRDPFTTPMAALDIEPIDVSSLPFPTIVAPTLPTIPTETTEPGEPTGTSEPTVPETSTTAAATVVPTVSGATPGLYGGSRELSVCDVQKLVEYLTTNVEKAAAWAKALGLAVDDIADYVASLTSVILSQDTRVTNHGFANGQPTPKQSILQAGTAVLVDALGIPRVRCFCGNPLKPPIPASKPPTYVGDPWPTFDPSVVVVVVPAPSPLDGLTVIDIETGIEVEVSVGPYIPVVDEPVDGATTSTTLPGAVDITAAGTVQASSEAAGHPVGNAIDGDDTTSWMSAGPGVDGDGSLYVWRGPSEQRIDRIIVRGNAAQADPALRSGHGFASVRIQIQGPAGDPVWEEERTLAGTPDPDVTVTPGVVGTTIALLFSGPESDGPNGFAELVVQAVDGPAATTVPSTSTTAPFSITSLPPAEGNEVLSTRDFCGGLAEYRAIAEERFFITDFESLPPEQQAALRAEFVKFLQLALIDLAEVAPPEIAADVVLLRDAYGAETDLQAIFDLAETPEIAAAEDRLDTYITNVCGFD